MGKKMIFLSSKLHVKEQLSETQYDGLTSKKSEISIGSISSLVGPFSFHSTPGRHNKSKLNSSFCVD